MQKGPNFGPRHKIWDDAQKAFAGYGWYLQSVFFRLQRPVETDHFVRNVHRRSDKSKNGNGDFECNRIVHKRRYLVIKKNDCIPVIVIMPGTDYTGYSKMIQKQKRKIWILEEKVSRRTFGG